MRGPAIRIAIVEADGSADTWITWMPIRTASMREVWKAIDEAAEATKINAARDYALLLGRLQ